MRDQTHSRQDLIDIFESVKILVRWLRMLRPIESEEDLAEAMRNLSGFMDMDPERGSREGAMLGTLAILITDYEREHEPREEAPVPPTCRELMEKLRDLEAIFDARWRADMRAIRRWHEAGNPELTWPDHADLVVWLLERLERAERG